uniref:LITAF domain-containing protein n=1 Tax=Takifugu rubripes TaxID=31033 RepID=A0A3B5KL62_TAKRU
MCIHMSSDSFQMEKGHPPQDLAPPYPGPPMNYGSAPGMYPQPGINPQPGPAPPPPGYQGVYFVCFSSVTHVVVSPALHDVPGQTLCPHCQQTVITRTEPTAGLMTWLVCAALGFFGCFLCCFIPFCIESCQDIMHRCPSCNRVIYIYKRMS